MTITNTSNHDLQLPNIEVGNPPPELKWLGSHQAYQAAVLMSFGFLKLTLHDGDGKLVQDRTPMPWVTPTLSLTTLKPNDHVEMNFDLTELFACTQPGLHTLRVQYGRSELLAETSVDIQIQAQ
jgi:hypothetical protein